MGPAAQAFHDVVSLVQAIIWPLAIVALVLVLRPYLPGLVEGVGRRVSRISWASLSVEFAVASEVRPEIWKSLAYLRDPAATARVPDSGQALFTLIRAGERADSATIDLGAGDRWLRSRLYIFAQVLSEVIGVRCLVFVETREGLTRRFAGLSNPRAVCAALEHHDAWLGGALISAQLDYYTLGGKSSPEFNEFKNFLEQKRDTLDTLVPYDLGPTLSPLAGAAYRAADLTDAQTAEAVASRYLSSPLLYREVAATAAKKKGWIRLGKTSYDPKKVREERTRWIKGGEDLDNILDDALTHPYVIETTGTEVQDLQRDAIRQHTSDFVAVLDSEGRFRRLLNRQEVADQLAREVATQMP